MKATQETLRMAGRLLSLHSDELPVEFVEKLERLRASGQYELMEEREEALAETAESLHRATIEALLLRARPVVPQGATLNRTPDFKGSSRKEDVMDIIRAEKGREIVGRPYSGRDVMAEVVELLGAIKKLDFEAIMEEISDVCWTSLMYLHFVTGWNIPVIGGLATYRKGVARQAVWREIFSLYGLEFHQKYLVGGSNYEKPEKVAKAISLAIEEAREKAEAEMKTLTEEVERVRAFGRAWRCLEVAEAEYQTAHREGDYLDVQQAWIEVILAGKEMQEAQEALSGEKGLCAYTVRVRGDLTASL